MTTRELPGRGIWRFRTDGLEYINRQDLVHSTGQPLFPKTLIDYIYYRYGLFGVIGGLTKGGVLLKRGYSSRGKIKSCL
jgi:hypothetical protein